jgi:hypothetical protein
MTEYFPKWIELAPLYGKSSEGTNYAFLDRIFSRFDASGKMLIN